MNKLICGSCSIKQAVFVIFLSLPLWGVAATSLPIGTLEQKASLSSGLEYNTNPIMSPILKRSVWQLNLNPRYKISDFNDLNEWYADFGLRVVRSSDTQIVIDRENPTLDLGWKRELERGSLGLIAHYDEASSLVTEFDESGLVAVDTTRVAKSIQANWDYILTDKMILGFNSSFIKTKFSGSSSNLVGSKNATLGGNITYAINDTLRSVSQISWSKFTPDNLQAESRNTNFNTGFDWSYNEHIDLGFRVGMNKISGQNAGSGWNASTNNAYRTERSVTRFDAARSVAPTGLGQLTTSDRFSAGWNYDISDRSSMGLNYSFSKLRGLFQTESIQYSANYNYDLSERWKAVVNTSYRELGNGNNNNTSAKIIGFTLSYDHPVF